MVYSKRILFEQEQNRIKKVWILHYYEVVKRLHSEGSSAEGSSFLHWGPSFSYLVIRYFLLVYSLNQQSSPCNRSISSKPIQSHLFFMKTQFKLGSLSCSGTASGGPKAIVGGYLECPKTIQPKPGTQSTTTLERIQRHRTSPDGKYLNLGQ